MNLKRGSSCLVSYSHRLNCLPAWQFALRLALKSKTHLHIACVTLVRQISPLHQLKAPTTILRLLPSYLVFSLHPLSAIDTPVPTTAKVIHIRERSVSCTSHHPLRVF